MIKCFLTEFESNLLWHKRTTILEIVTATHDYLARDPVRVIEIIERFRADRSLVNFDS